MRNGIAIRARTPNASGSHARTTRVGVGEEITFTAPSAGTWTASRQFGTPPNDGRTFVWRVPEGAGAATVTWTPAHGEPRSLEMEVVEPSSIDFDLIGEKMMDPHGVGVDASLEMGPGDVSFAGAGWKEDSDGATGDAQQRQGYFRQFHEMGGNLRHTANWRWYDMCRGNDGGERPRDTAAIGGLPRIGGAFSAGSFHYEIPNRYRVGAASEGRPFRTSRQTFTMDARGQLTVTKGAGGRTVSLSRAAAASVAEEQPLRAATPAQMRELFRREGIAVLLERLRQEPDAEIKRELREAILRHEARMRLVVRCTNSYRWFGQADPVRVSINGQQALPTLSLATGAEDQASLRFREAFRDRIPDLERAEPTAQVIVNADDHPLPFALDPLRDVTDFVAVPGSDRYQYKYTLEQRGGEAGDAADAARLRAHR